jgi:hypothetical protein
MKYIDISMDLSLNFSLPLLIYDDNCSACKKFANIAKTLSRGRISIAGHYYSPEAIEIKKLIFPLYYDPTKMFWLINMKGAYGARLGLVQVVKEIIIGWFTGNGMKNEKNHDDKNNKGNSFSSLSCEYKDSSMSCNSPENILKRIISMMKSSGRFQF